MQFAVRLPQLPKHIWWLLALYCCVSFVHFAHNAEYIAFYPNMPRWITRENVYWAWLAITFPGIAALVAAAFGWRASAAVLLIAYASFGLDGLGHYALALCSQHTLAMNFTIWFEVLAGMVLAICASNHLREIAIGHHRPLRVHRRGGPYRTSLANSPSAVWRNPGSYDFYAPPHRSGSPQQALRDPFRLVSAYWR